MLFVNTGPRPVDLTCSADCWAATGLPIGMQVQVRDLWLHRDIGNTTTWQPLAATQVEADGGMVLFRLDPVTPARGS
jgi:hypothetical protein